MRRRELVLHYGSFLILADASSDAPERGPEDEWDTTVSVVEPRWPDMPAPQPVPLRARRFNDPDVALAEAIRAARAFIDAQHVA
jgi:hypothetical protein